MPKTDSKVLTEHKCRVEGHFPYITNTLLIIYGNQPDDTKDSSAARDIIYAMLCDLSLFSFFSREISLL